MTTTPTRPSDIPQEVPMFLRKTYHMIDSCDPEVAGWSDDGLTFIVKDPKRFESEIIPQFFKHSKFSSFVRQLNFYSFRKIKYLDSLRLLDPALEAKQSQYWRFVHPSFQRGKPHLLTHIKRMTAAQNKAAKEAATKVAAAAASMTPDAVGSSTASPSLVNSSNGNSQEMKEEIDTLKAKLEEMNRNMSELTSMVQQVTLSSDNAPESVGNKRKKVEFASQVNVAPPMNEPLPDSVPSAASSFADESLDMLMENPDDILFPNDHHLQEPSAAVQAIPMPMPIQVAPVRETSTMSNATDNDFVDQLFTAFGGDSDDVDAGDNTDMEMVAPVLPEPVNSNADKDNRPSPELMERLSEALAILPKDMQEQIVNRLIASIMSQSMPGPATPEKVEGDIVPHTPDDDDQVAVGMPLAAATLASLLQYYSTLVQQQNHAKDASTSNKNQVKTIPVIPCHA